MFTYVKYISIIQTEFRFERIFNDKAFFFPMA